VKGIRKVGAGALTKMNVKSSPLDEPFLAFSNPLNTDMNHLRSKTVMTGYEEVVTTIFPLPLKATRIF
jgi:hypothetical protein